MLLCILLASSYSRVVSNLSCISGNTGSLQEREHGNAYLVDLKGAEVVYGCSTPMYNIKDFKGVIVSILASTLATLRESSTTRLVILLYAYTPLLVSCILLLWRMNVTHIFGHGRTKAASDDAKILFGFRVSFVELSHTTTN